MGQRPDDVTTRETPTHANSETHIVRPGENVVVRSETAGQPGPRSTTTSTDGDPEIQTIRGDIDRTREDMSHTIEAIQDKLAPEILKEHAKDVVREVAHQAKDVMRSAGDQAKDVVREATGQAKDVVREATGQAKEAVRDATVGRVENMVTSANESIHEAGGGLVETIKRNPLPTALIGIGLGWLLMNGRSQTNTTNQTRYPYAGSDYRPWRSAASTQYSESSPTASGGTMGHIQSEVSHLADQAQHTVGEAAARAQQAAGSVAEQVQHTVGDFTDQTQQQVDQLAYEARMRATRARSDLEQLMHTNPLGVAAVALGIGAAIGFATPSTRHETQLMGEARDRLVRQAESALKETDQKIQSAIAESPDTNAEDQPASGERDDASRHAA